MLVCLLAGLVGAAVIRRLLSLHASGWMSEMMILAISLLFLFGCLEYIFVWQRQEKRGKGNSQARLIFLQGLLLYFLAYDFSAFGWHKIFHLQMAVPLGELDRPFRSLDSETLTWAYFRRSYPFTVAIASTQIISSLMLLFARTRLLGLVIMVPVLINIILIDTFYQLHTGVLVHALILFSGVIYLLLQSYNSLVNFFFKTTHLVIGADKTNPWLRAGLIVVPLLLLTTYSFPDKHPQLTSKYLVNNLKVNGIPVSAKSAKDSVLTAVYLDWQDDLVLMFNHYNSRYIGTYYFDSNTDSISVKWRYPADFTAPFNGKFIPEGKKGNYHFTGILGKDSIDMQLEKMPEP